MAMEKLHSAEQNFCEELIKTCTEDQLGLIDYSGSDQEQADLNEDVDELGIDDLEELGQEQEGSKKKRKKLKNEATEKSFQDWSEQEDLSLLNHYETNQHLMEKNARKFWVTLIRLMNNDAQITDQPVYSLKDVKGRISKLQKIYKDAVKSNEKTGNKPSTCRNYEVYD